jgi:hypothetical protein
MSALVAERRRVYPGLDQAVLRALVLVGAMASVVAAQAAGARPNLWGQLLLTALALVLAFRPESSVGPVLLIGLAYVWSTVSDPLSPLVLLAAAGMVIVHEAALVAAQGPVTMRVDRTQALRHCGRGALLWLAAAIVWGLALVADALPDGRLVYAVGLTLLLGLAAGAATLIGPRR